MFSLIYKALDKIRTYGVVGLLAFVIVLCLIQVILRYFTSAELKPFSWGDEVIKLTCIWVVFLASSMGARYGTHMTVDYFIDKYLTPGKRKLVKSLTLLLVLAVLAALIYYGALYAYSMRNSSLQNLNLSMGYFYAAIPVGCAFLFMEYALMLLGINPERSCK